MGSLEKFEKEFLVLLFRDNPCQTGSD